jgi:hypothetical protein
LRMRKNLFHLVNHRYLHFKTDFIISASRKVAFKPKSMFRKSCCCFGLLEFFKAWFKQNQEWLELVVDQFPDVLGTARERANPSAIFG